MLCEERFGDRAECQSIDRPYEAVAFVVEGNVRDRRIAALQCVYHLPGFRRHHPDVVQALRDEDRPRSALEMVER